MTPTSGVSVHKTSSVTKLQISLKKLILFTVELLLAIPLGYVLAQFNFGGIAWSEINFTPLSLSNLIGQILLGITIGEDWGEKPTFSK